MGGGITPLVKLLQPQPTLSSADNDSPCCRAQDYAICTLWHLAALAPNRVLILSKRLDAIPLLLAMLEQDDGRARLLSTMVLVRLADHGRAQASAIVEHPSAIPLLVGLLKERVVLKEASLVKGPPRHRDHPLAKEPPLISKDATLKEPARQTLSEPTRQVAARALAAISAVR